MDVVGLTCPFCNAPLSHVAVKNLGDQAASCPRCGERLPVEISARLPRTVGTEPTTSTPVNSLVPGKRKTLAVIGAIMFSMAALAAVFAYCTRDFRRANDYRTQKKSAPGPVTSATESALVGYLPARCNVVASLHLTELHKHPIARKMLDEPPLTGLLQALPQWTGLTATDLEQVAIGAEIKDQLPQVVMIVHTRQPYAPGKFAAALPSAQMTQHRQKPLIRFPMPPAGEGLIWQHSDRLLVVAAGLGAVAKDDLDAVPPRPRPGAQGFAAPLANALEQRLPAASPLWIAGHFDQPPAVGDLLAMAGGKGASWATLLETKTFVVSIQTDGVPTLMAHFFTGSAKTSSKLEALLQAHHLAGAQSYKVVGPPPGSDAADQWVTLQARGELGKWFASWWK